MNAITACLKRIVKNGKFLTDSNLIDPVGKPGELYSYSDTGYVLVGNIIERITHKTLPASVRQYINFEKLGLRQTYWEKYERQPTTVNRAHQYFQGKDTYSWNPTMDMYGGGGLVACWVLLSVFCRSMVKREEQSRSLFGLFYSLYLWVTQR